MGEYGFELMFCIISSIATAALYLSSSYSEPGDI
jgi:hypothetical protein